MVKSLALALAILMATPNGTQNAFSKSAVRVVGKTYVVAPDGKTRVTLGTVLKSGGSHLLLKFNVGEKPSSFDVGRGIEAELLWAPDSKALAITTSNGSSSGIFNLFVFFSEGNSVKQLDVTPEIRKVFGQPVVCAYPEPPNVAAVAWLESSARLLVAAQIVNHSVCDSFGTFKLYELETPSLVVKKTYDQLEAKRLFGSSLGLFLKEARDVCITNPKACEVPSNHKAKARLGRKPSRETPVGPMALRSAR